MTNGDATTTRTPTLFWCERCRASWIFAVDYHGTIYDVADELRAAHDRHAVARAQACTFDAYRVRMHIGPLDIRTAAHTRNARDLPARVYVCRDRDRHDGEETLTISDTPAAFADRDVVGVYDRVNVTTLHSRARTRGSRRALLTP